MQERDLAIAGLQPDLLSDQLYRRRFLLITQQTLLLARHWVSEMTHLCVKLGLLSLFILPSFLLISALSQPLKLLKSSFKQKRKRLNGGVADPPPELTGDDDGQLLVRVRLLPLHHQSLESS